MDKRENAFSLDSYLVKSHGYFRQLSVDTSVPIRNNPKNMFRVRNERIPADALSPFGSEPIKVWVAEYENFLCALVDLYVQADVLRRRDGADYVHVGFQRIGNGKLEDDNPPDVTKILANPPVTIDAMLTFYIIRKDKSLNG